MSKYYILFIAVILGSNLFSQTSVSGGIYQNTTWSLANSPYIVNGSIVVFPGRTLNIEPGVEIRINNQLDSTIYIETRGTLNCLGTDLSPIKISTLYDTTKVGWRGFVCTSSQGGVLNADRFQISNASMPFAYETPMANFQYTNCKFSHCFQAVTVGQAVNLTNCQFIDNEVAVYGWSYFTIDNCLFKDNTTSIYAYCTALTMTNSSFIDNQIGLTFASNVSETISISDCQFLNNGLAINYPNKGSIENCLFSENSTGIQMAYKCEILNNEFIYNDLAIEASVDANIHDNQISNNLGGLLISNVTAVQDSPQIYNNEICNNSNYCVNNNTNMNYSLLENCFCGLDSTQIEALIIDGYDDIIKGLINYQVFDSTCTTSLKVVLKFNSTVAALNESNIEISFTNPVENTLICFNSNPVFVIEIMDLSGKIYYFKSETENQFDLGTLKSGFYFIKSLNNQTINKSFVKL
jgi:hypothetical protein